MNTFNKILLLVFSCATVVFCACERHFNDLNLDPNRPERATPGVLLGQLQYRIVNAKLNDAKNLTHELMQVHVPRASANINSIMRWFLEPREGIWNNYYTALADVDDLYAISEELGEENYMAIALVLKAYVFSILTDLYGDIPCLEATQGSSGNFLPAFDRQQVVYEQILTWLAEANRLVEVGEPLLYGGDMIYHAHSNGANMLKWKKFANSLTLRVLLRAHNRSDVLDVSSQLSRILEDQVTYPVFAANDDEAIFEYTGVFPYYNPFYNARTFDWRDNQYFTTFFLETLNNTNDPRRTVWARTVVDGGNPVYRGIPSAYALSDEFDVDANSNYSDHLKTLPQLGMLMTYAELEFIKAELVLRGYTSGADASTHYENGIRASMAQWNVNVPQNFFTQAAIQYPAAGTFQQQLEKIMLQKYYASFFIDYQSWFEYRRTGYPVLPKGASIPADREFPRRIPYPLYLQSLNAEKLAEAVQQMGGDDCYIRVWWDID